MDPFVISTNPHFEYHSRSLLYLQPSSNAQDRAAASATEPTGFRHSMDSQAIHNLIQSGMPDAKITVHGADGVHFEALVVSAAFVGKMPLARHRMVYATLGEHMGNAIHALALRTLTPEEADRQ